MQSQCPHCCSSFDIPDSALAAAEGIVRCGQCMQLFNAVEHEVALTENETCSHSETDESLLDTDTGQPSSANQNVEPNPEPDLELNAEPHAALISTQEQNNAEVITDALNGPLDQNDGLESPPNTSENTLDPANSTFAKAVDAEPLADIPSLESYHDAIAEAAESEEPYDSIGNEEQQLTAPDALEIPEFASGDFVAEGIASEDIVSENIVPEDIVSGEVASEDFAARNIQQEYAPADAAAHSTTAEAAQEAEENAVADTFLFENDAELQDQPLFASDASALAGLSAEDDAIELLSMEASPAIEEVSLAPLTELGDDSGSTLQSGPTQKGKTAFVFATALVLCIGLAIQWLAATGKHTLLPENVSGPLFSKVCQVIYCDGDEVNLAYESLEFLMHSHPETPNALLLKTTLINAGNEPLPFPHLLLEFSNLDDELLARREFKPEEYLGQDLLQSNNLLKNNTPVEIQLELADPGSEAVNYTIHYFLPTS